MNEKKMNIGLLVLGMGRSGTSAMTGLLHHLGIPAAGELLPAADDNQKGFFENKTVTLFHDRLLAHLGSAWDDPMPVSTQFVETPLGQGFVGELSDIIKSELLVKTSAFSIKDPRMCRFVPLWKAALRATNTEPRAIIPVRNPLDVASSLASRDKFPRAKSFLLWLDYSLAAERETRDVPRSFISYDRLISDWRGVSDKLADDLKLSWPKERERVEDAIDHFLTCDLRHHATSSVIGKATRLDHLVTQSWTAFCALVENEADQAAYQTLDAVRQELSEATAVVLPYVSWEFAALTEARREIHRLSHLNTTLQQSRDEMEVELLELNGKEVALRQDLQEERHHHQLVVNAIKSSTSWRLTAPIRATVGALPPAVKTAIRRIAKAGWWIATPWKMPARIRFLRERRH